MQTVIVAGGYGTRMREHIGDLPKSLIPIDSSPFISLQLEWLKYSSQIQLCLGYKSHEIIETLNQLDVSKDLSWSIEDESLGVLGSVYHSRHDLNENFAVLLGDVIPRFDYAEMIRNASKHLSKGNSVMFIAPAQNIPGQKGNVDIDNKMITTYCKGESYIGPYVDIGFWVLQRDHVVKFAKNAKEEEFFKSIINENSLAYELVSQGSWEVGSIEGLINLVNEKNKIYIDLESEVHIR